MFVVWNFSYLEIADVLFIVWLQIKNMYVCMYVCMYYRSPLPLIWRTGSATVSAGTIITKESKKPNNRALLGALLFGCIFSLVVRNLCLGSYRKDHCLWVIKYIQIVASSHLKIANFFLTYWTSGRGLLKVKWPLCLTQVQTHFQNTLHLGYLKSLSAKSII